MGDHAWARVRTAAFIFGFDAQRRDPDLAGRRLTAFRNNRAIAEEADPDTVALDDRRLSCFIEIATGTGDADPLA